MNKKLSVIMLVAVLGFGGCKRGVKKVEPKKQEKSAEQVNIPLVATDTKSFFEDDINEFEVLENQTTPTPAVVAQEPVQAVSTEEDFLQAADYEQQFAWADEAQPDQSQEFPINGIRAVVFYEDESDVITDMQLKRPGLDGVMHSTQDLTFRSKVRHEAFKFKMDPDDDAVREHLTAIKQQNNLSDEDFNRLLKQNGFTLEQAEQEFRDIIAENTVLDYKIRSRLIVPRTLVEEYYQNNPVMTDEEVFLEHAVVPFDTALTHAEQRTILEAQIAGREEVYIINWEKPFWISTTDLAQDKKFVANLSAGAACIVDELSDGFELFKLVEKKEARLLTLDERYNEIVELLKRPKYEEMMHEFRESLAQSAAVLIFPVE